MSAPAKRGPKQRPRIRTLKPEVWQDEAMAELSLQARLLFVGLTTQADDEGRQSANPALLRSRIFPFDDLDPEDLEAWLVELDEAGLVVRYNADERSYLHLTTWADDQKVDRPTGSVLPPPPEPFANSREHSASIREDVTNPRAGPDRTGPGPEGTGAAPERELAPRLRTAADLVYTIVNDVAVMSKSSPVTQERVDRLIAGAPGWLDHSLAAEAWRDYFQHGKGAGRPPKDALASYRNWIGREKPPLAAVPAGPKIDPNIYDQHVQVPA